MKLTFFLLIGILFLASFLRFYKIEEVPHGLYIDEVSIAYNAYTIERDGVDEYGEAYPLFFKAFGEYKMPVPIYLTSASIAVFGKNDFAVRFPSALFGVLTVLLLYLAVKKLFQKESVALLSALLLAITPWHIQFSRANFETNIALFFFTLGGVVFLYFFQNKKKLLLFLSFFFLLITAYTYNAYRLIAPVALIFCSILIYRSFPQIRKFLVTTLMIMLVIFVPLITFSLSSDGSRRFNDTSAFMNLEDISIVEKVIVYPKVYLTNYFAFFSFPYLFVNGDGNGRHSIVGMGSLFRWEVIFLLAGGYFLFKNRKEPYAKGTAVILFLAPVTAAFTSPSPHGLRSLLMVLPLTVIVAYGIVMLWQKKFFFRKLFFLGILFFAVYEFFFYLHLYYIHYPLRTAPDWGGGFKEVIFEATKEQKNYSRIVINDNVGGTIPNYINFYNDALVYELVNDGWYKPEAWKDEKILYITSSNEKRNSNLKKMPHTLIKNLELRSYNKGIFAQFWEL